MYPSLPPNHRRTQIKQADAIHCFFKKMQAATASSACGSSVMVTHLLEPFWFGYQPDTVTTRFTLRGNIDISPILITIPLLKFMVHMRDVFPWYSHDCNLTFKYAFIKIRNVLSIIRKGKLF